MRSRSRPSAIVVPEIRWTSRSEGRAVADCAGVDNGVVALPVAFSVTVIASSRLSQRATEPTASAAMRTRVLLRVIDHIAGEAQSQTFVGEQSTWRQGAIRGLSSIAKPTRQKSRV